MWLENHRHTDKSQHLIFFVIFFFLNRLGFHTGSDHWYWFWCLHINLVSVVNYSGICFLPWKQDSLDFWFGSKIKTRLGTEHIIAYYIICFNSHQWFCQMQPKILNQNFKRKLLKHTPLSRQALISQISWRSCMGIHSCVLFQGSITTCNSCCWNLSCYGLRTCLCQIVTFLFLNSLRQYKNRVRSHFFWSKLGSLCRIWELRLSRNPRSTCLAIWQNTPK